MVAELPRPGTGDGEVFYIRYTTDDLVGEAITTDQTTDQSFQLDVTPTKRVTAVELVRDVLRLAIIRGDLPGGSRLVQTDIAAQLNVSTTPVREAMRDLASEGLITLDTHKIGLVRGPDWDEMVEIVEIRRALEPVALERAMINITPAEMSTGRTLAEQLAHEEEIGSWVQTNARFHSVFHRATRTKRLAGMLVALEEAGGVFVAQAQQLHPEIRRRAIADHFSLLEAFENKDMEKAVGVQRGHLQLPLDSHAMDARS